MQARTQARNCLAKAIKASHGPRVSPPAQAEEKVKKTTENPPGRFIWAGEGAIQVSKESGNVQTLKTIIQDLENLKSETSPGKSGISSYGTGLYHWDVVDSWGMEPRWKEQRLEFGWMEWSRELCWMTWRLQTIVLHTRALKSTWQLRKGDSGQGHQIYR